MQRKRLGALAAFVAGVLVCGVAVAKPPPKKHDGFQTSVKPYAKGVPGSGWVTEPIISAGDMVPETAKTGAQYRMVGIPDGLGVERPQPVLEPRQAFGAAVQDGVVGLSHERVEAVAVALRVAARQGCETRRRRREHLRIALDNRRLLAAPAPQRLRVLLVEDERFAGAVELEPEPVLAAGRDLADDRRSDRPPVGLELHHRGVLGSDLAELAGLGPFVLREYQPGQRVILERNPRYWRTAPDGTPLPYLDRIVLEIVPEQNAELLRLQPNSCLRRSRKTIYRRPEDLELYVEALRKTAPETPVELVAAVARLTGVA